MREPSTGITTEIRQYLMVTGSYWAFTLTDGALRMLIVLHFYSLGYSPLNLAMLFVLYEFLGMLTNLFGGYLATRIGLNRTLHIGLGLQVLALGLLAAPDDLSVAWVVMAQALSGVAKDLNKMSAKSSIKTLVNATQSNHQTRLYRWVAILTGSKNTLKGVGFFLGGALLSGLGFRGALLTMSLALMLVWLLSLLLLTNDLGKSKSKAKFSQMFSKSLAINYLSAARLFLFAARDVWFVVALPAFLVTQLGWQHYQIGAFFALWLMGYGAVQTMAPVITGRAEQLQPSRSASIWALLLAALPAAIALMMSESNTLFNMTGNPMGVSVMLIIGLVAFGVVFAVNSSLHSYLIVRYAAADGVSMDVGFYYTANAAGRLLGTVLSGWVYQYWGLAACFWISTLFIALAALLSRALPKY